MEAGMTAMYQVRENLLSGISARKLECTKPTGHFGTSIQICRGTHGLRIHHTEFPVVSSGSIIPFRRAGLRCCELHDDISQRLALLTIELEQFRKRFFDLPAELKKKSSEIAQDVQSLSHGLHSSKLEYLGVVAAMGAFCHEYSDQQNVEVIFVHDEVPGTIPKEISLCLFRVLQEALQNARKHSGVRHFDAELRCTPDAIELTVRDSGCGLDPQQAMKTRGLGLISMAERMKLVDGQLSIDSLPNRGTTIHARVPLNVRSASLRATG
jgi:signal transduction histidine kinase